MRHIFFIFTVWLLAAVSCFGTGADSALIKTDINLEEIVISSIKSSGTFEQSPVAATVIHGSDLESRNALTTKDLALFTPNLFMPDYGSKLTSPIYIRGIGSKINSPSVGLYVDGVPYFEKSAFDFDLFDIESIEILRGPQGTLYGRNTMGGIIDIRTKSPLKYKGLGVTLNGGNYGFFNGIMSFYGSDVKNRLGFTASINMTHHDGYFLNNTLGYNADSLNTFGVRFGLDYRAAENFVIKWRTSVDKLNQGGYPYAEVDNSGKIGDVTYNDHSSYKREIVSNGLSLIYRGKNFDINSQTSMQYLKDKQSIDQDFTPSATYFVIQDQKQITLSQEFTIKSNNKTNYKWIVGMFDFYQRINNELETKMLAAGYTTDKYYLIPTSGASIYHQSEYKNLFIEGLSVTAGVRFDHERATDHYGAYKNTESQRIQTDTFTNKLKYNRLTPKIAFQYNLERTKTAYISVTEGYKTGGFNTSFAREEDQSFDPEYSWNYEAGFKAKFLENRLYFDIAFFYIDWKSQQIYQPLPVIPGQTYIGGQMLTNAGRSESKGAEISILSEPYKGLKLRLDCGYTDATFKKHQRDANTDYSGNKIPFAPRGTLVAGVDYTHPVNKKHCKHVTIDINYHGIDKLYWNEANTASQSYYGLLNGKISFALLPVTLSIWAKNITNADYSAYYFESQGKKFAQRGRPFTAGLTITVRN
ncbi:MAG: TonB-dependent receptor [Dysgonamonadaceae bacterium]|jgi:outer membrane receptor protein involved in Fe transport|nr:TonB-dependent receptor [Dysgonamonadaceae bacterium]